MNLRFAWEYHNRQADLTTHSPQYSAQEKVLLQAQASMATSLMALQLSAERISLGMAMKTPGNINLSAEVSMDDDYSNADDGTGEPTENIILQFKAAF